MTQIVLSAIVASAFAVILLSGASSKAVQTPPVKIINSTNIRELKPRLPAEDKSGAITYVYPVPKMQVNRTNTNTSTNTNNRTVDNPNSADSEDPKMCLYRVLEGDYQLVSYNATKEELADNGKEIYDMICPGDDEWDKISAGALASLCCG